MITHKEVLENFEQQIDFALSNYIPHKYSVESFNNVIICGLGGSGISGRMVKAYLTDKISIPIETVSEYYLPAYVNNKTLVILGSYSGNTEETLAMFEEALSKQAGMLILTSGGKLKELAEQHNITCYNLAKDYQPRQALGFSFGFLVQIFGELIGTDFKNDLIEARDSIKDDNQSLIDSAEAVFDKFKKTLREKFVIVTDSKFEAVGIRFAQQLQENAKCEAFVNVLPEANHNVIESYYGHLDTNFILLRSLDNDRVNVRFDFLNGLLEVENNKIVNIAVEEYSVRTILETVYLLDWVSVWAADEKGVDAMTVGNIMSLKDYLSEV